jgi:hypothetical protein
MMLCKLSSIYLKLSSSSPKCFQANLTQTCFRNWHSRKKLANMALPRKSGLFLSLPSNLVCKSPPKLRFLSMPMTGQGFSLSRIRTTISREVRLESSSIGLTSVQVALVTPTPSIRWAIRACPSSTIRCTINYTPIRTNTIWVKLSGGCSSSITLSKAKFNSSAIRCSKIRTCK